MFCISCSVYLKQKSRFGHCPDCEAKIQIFRKKQNLENVRKLEEAKNEKSTHENGRYRTKTHIKWRTQKIQQALKMRREGIEWKHITEVTGLFPSQLRVIFQKEGLIKQHKKHE
jgi:hypothetical protein